MTHLVDIFLQPSRVFAELKEKPTFLVPLLLVMALTAAFTLLYFTTVDSTWFLDHMLMAQGSEINAADLARMKQAMPGTRTMGYIGAPTAVLGVGVASALYALYFMLAGKLTGAEINFRRGLSLNCWSNMPMVLGLLVALGSAATMSPQTTLESLMLTNLDPLLLQVPVDSPWLKLAQGFNLLNFWVWFLAALGWRTWTKASWAQSIIVAVLPSVVIFGVMAAIAALK